MGIIFSELYYDKKDMKGRIMIYICDSIENAVIDESKWILPYERNEKAGRYKMERDRRLCRIAYCLFAYGLYDKYGFEKNSALDWCTGQHGKPYLKNFTDIHFNISHCKYCAVCGFSECEIGVDVQEYPDNISDRLMKIVCSDGERKNINNSDSREKLFIKYWSLKESYLKCIGTGICGKMSDVDFCRINSDNFEEYNKKFSVFQYDNYCISVCSDRYFKSEDLIFINNFI
jgi:4'-phosphopantetheinyl transferase